MEAKVTAIQMRAKFGEILDRVAKKGDHITILRGERPIATLIPTHEHVSQCIDRDRVQRVEDVLATLDAWKRKHPVKARKLAKVDWVAEIRKMRESR